MKGKVAYLTMLVPVAFCVIKSSNMNSLNFQMLQWSITYALIAVLVFNKKSSVMFFASIFNGLLSLLCLYVFLPKEFVKAAEVFSHPVLCVVFMLCITYPIQKLVSTKIAL